MKLLVPLTLWHYADVLNSSERNQFYQKESYT